MTDQQKKINFIENSLPKLILERNEELKNHDIVKCTATPNSQLDGFMAAIYSVELVLKNPNEEIETHKIIVKIMKGDHDFREKTSSFLQCSNEIYSYRNVIPYFKKFITENPVTTFNPDKWVPRIYYADHKVYKELNDDVECVLALENLTPQGFRLGPRIDLDEKHLSLMVEHIASYHAVSYAMRIKNDSMFGELASGLNPFEFLSDDGKEMQSYNILYKIGLERVFTLAEKTEELHSDTALMDSVKKIKEKMYERPVVIMQKLLAKDDTFCVFLHGDYNRNNVLFDYEKSEGFDSPLELRMFDYQETRVATPTIDLAFFMYMNNIPTIEGIWDELLELYHRTYMKCLIDILKCEENDPRLLPYSYENFINHFTKHAFYGVMTCFHFVPFMACSSEECERISYLFETDMKGDEFRQILQVCGGKSLDDRLISALVHSHKKGYLKIFD
ncbi:unnamed protein product [Chironomus riparius]|uniref:CHK kinase-like domain-containing protein n=1 Tax=Chironomus riparius TaxID=315576 RepID=A0A9N9WWS5_9DIPT|nr:unnamed protein product [Chironomus riparius]